MTGRNNFPEPMGDLQAAREPVSGGWSLPFQSRSEAAKKGCSAQVAHEGCQRVLHLL